MDILKTLSNGLVIRRATMADTDALVDLQIHAFANPDTGELDHYLGGWTRDLMSGKHPTFRPEDFLVVQDTKMGALVSCTCLISQVWTMDGISIRVGRPEIVGTLQEYRRRGLIREQFKILHEWSHARGEMVQAITGIPYYYRQFGYEFALELVAPRQTFVPQQIPELKEGEQEKFRLRRAKQNDLSFIAELYKQSCARSYVSCTRDETMFEYENFLENNSLNGNASWWDVIETQDGMRAGIVMHRRYVYQGRHSSHCYEILPQFAWDEVTPCVLRALTQQANAMELEDKQPLAKLGWLLQANHPFYEIMPERTAPLFGGYAWYVRVPDIPAFLQRLAPLFEKRIAASNFRGLTEALRLNFYRDGVEMIFENGKIKAAQTWRATAGDFGQSGFGAAAFPELTFLKILFGYCSRAELQTMFPDCLTNGDKSSALLDVLFPKQISHVMPIH